MVFGMKKAEDIFPSLPARNEREPERGETDEKRPPLPALSSFFREEREKRSAVTPQANYLPKTRCVLGFVILRLKFQVSEAYSLRHENLVPSLRRCLVRQHRLGSRGRHALLRIAHVLRRAWQTGRAQCALPQSHDADF